MRERHKDVEIVIRSNGTDFAFKTLNEASGFAVGLSRSTGTPVNIDVLVHSEAGARFLDGDHGVEAYREDPEASVYDRVTVMAISQGRIA